jgi:hypothetical protein
MPTGRRPAAFAVAGPALIMGAVAVVLWPLLAGRVFPVQADPLGYWLPTYCYLGKTILGGHIPAWNPHTLAGTPFLADPQSGWFSPVVVALFGFLPCLVALRIYLVLQPVLAGLGLYWFLRAERAGRPAATVGALALALPVAGSAYVALPWLSASLAWTALALAAAARLVRATTWPSRLWWILATALAWGQVAVAHPSNGLVIGTLAVVLYLTARLGTDVRGGLRTGGQALATAAVVVVAAPLVNLAILLPRLASLPGTTQGLGYAALRASTLRFSGGSFDGLVLARGGLRASWPLAFGLWPGAYVGAMTLAVAFAAWFCRGRRAVAAAFSALGLACYLLTLDPVARAVGRLGESSRLVDLYLHAPNQFDFGLLLALAVLGGMGVQAWIDARSWRTRVAMVAPGLVVWGLLPVHTGAAAGLRLPFAVGLAAGAAAMWAVATRPRLAPLLPCLLALELAVTGAVAQAPDRPDRTIRSDPTPIAMPRMLEEDVTDFARAGPIARALAEATGDANDARYVSLAPRIWGPWGYVSHQRPEDAGLLGAGQATILGLHEAQGYTPYQLAATWTLVRAAQPGAPIRYASSYFRDAAPRAFDLLGVGWVVAPTDGGAPVTGATPVATQGPWTLFRLVDPPPMAFVVTGWRTPPTGTGALEAALDPAFDPDSSVILDANPVVPAAVASGTSEASGTATVVDETAGSARVDVDALAGGVVVIRVPFDPRWRASVDGVPTRLLRADGLLQAVAVRPGRHTIRLGYVDPTIGAGMLGSAAAVLSLAGVGFALSRRRRRRSALPAAA